MAITDYTRKLLWGRSGNCCALCKQQLVELGTAPDPDAVVGDECHIVAQAKGGPRARTLSPERLDEYDNLILLCKVDHKRVDDQPTTYATAELRAIKASHERWVEAALNVNKPKQNETEGETPRIVRVERIETGKQLLDIVGNCLALHFDHPEPVSEEDAEAIAELSGQAHDWMDIYDDVDAGARVREGFRLTSLIRTVEAHGLTVWGGHYVGPLVGGNNPLTGSVGVLVIRRIDPSSVATDDPTISPR